MNSTKDSSSLKTKLKVLWNEESISHHVTKKVELELWITPESLMKNKLKS